MFPTSTPPRPPLRSETACRSSARSSGSVRVQAVVDDTGGPGVASAVLRIAGKMVPDVTGTTGDSGAIRAYIFNVPGTVQAAGSEAPINFTIVATDTAGGVTPEAA